MVQSDVRALEPVWRERDKLGLLLILVVFVDYHTL